MLEYVDKIINPYVFKKREELKLDVEFPALVLFDLNPMDLSINKPFKDQLKHLFIHGMLHKFNLIEVETTY